MSLKIEVKVLNENRENVKKPVRAGLWKTLLWLISLVPYRFTLVLVLLAVPLAYTWAWELHTYAWVTETPETVRLNVHNQIEVISETPFTLWGNSYCDFHVEGAGEFPDPVLVPTAPIATDPDGKGVYFDLKVVTPPGQFTIVYDNPNPGDCWSNWKVISDSPAFIKTTPSPGYHARNGYVGAVIWSVLWLIVALFTGTFLDGKFQERVL